MLSNQLTDNVIEGLGVSELLGVQDLVWEGLVDLVWEGLVDLELL